MQSLGEASEQGLWGQEFNAGCGQLDRKGESIQTHTNFRHGSGILCRQAKRRQVGLSALYKESHRDVLHEALRLWKACQIRHSQRRERKLLLYMKVEHFTARHKYFQATSYRQ